MAEGGSKFNRRGAQILGRSGLAPGLEQIDKALTKKGFSPSANLAKQARKKKEGEAKQKQSIRVQKQREQLRLAEAGDVVGRQRLLAQVGGRQSLVAR